MSILSSTHLLEKLARLCEQYDATFYSDSRTGDIKISINNDHHVTVECCSDGKETAIALRGEAGRLE